MDANIIRFFIFVYFLINPYSIKEGAEAVRKPNDKFHEIKKFNKDKEFFFFPVPLTLKLNIVHMFIFIFLLIYEKIFPHF